MLALLVAAAGATGATGGGEVAALERTWRGVRDSSEQVVMSLARGAALWTQASERRVRTIVAPVNLPWLGPHVLYLEEFLEDDPEYPRRQVLMRLEAVPGAKPAVRARLFTFVTPERWKHLNYRPALASKLTRADLVAAPGCDLVLRRVGAQFRGGTVGRGCLATGAGPTRFVEYRLVVGADMYWYRRRIVRREDFELQQEVIGFNRFEPEAARLYECRVGWSASGAARDLKPLTTLELYEEGGHARFATPDGRALELTLHGRDWPFDLNRDALILLLGQDGSEAPFASAWAQLDDQRVTLALGWLEVRCGALAPDSDEDRQ